ncbi:MAG: hypothetical protein INR71_15240 [Terriglobus roseus]|nr:hypothetical protein [Terriglobus roseus]
MRPKIAIKRATRLGARYFLAIGAAELAAQQGQLRRLEDGNTQAVALTGEALRELCRPLG